MQRLLSFRTHTVSGVQPFYWHDDCPTDRWRSFANSGLLLAFALLLLGGSLRADVTFSDTTFNLSDYSQQTYISDPNTQITVQQIQTGGNPGPALDISYNLPATAEDNFVGLIRPSFSYDPAAQGAIQNINFSIDKYVTQTECDTPSCSLTTNIARPMIFQNGNYYMAIINIPGPAATYITATATLNSTDFGLFSFTTGNLNTSVNPSFTSGAMQFGFANRYLVANAPPGPIQVDVRYDNWTTVVNSAPPLPAISASGGVENGASFTSSISAGSWITIAGTNLSSKTDTWNNSIVNGALPTTLDGVSVTVGGQPAYIEYVSATQINAIAPNVPTGSIPVIVTNSNGASQAINVQLTAETPAFFQWGTYAVATHQDYTYAVKNGTFAGLTTVPAKSGDVIILWGTGFGPTSPAAPAGMETPATTVYNTATAVSVTVGGRTATVYGAALASGFAGLYQVAIQIPAGLASGDYPVVATIDGVSSSPTTLITVQL